MRAIIKLKHRALSCGTWDGVELRRGAQETDNVSWETWEKIKKSGDPIELVREIPEEEDIKALEVVEEPKVVEPEIIEEPMPEPVEFPEVEAPDEPVKLFDEEEAKPEPKKKPAKKAKKAKKRK